MPRSEEFAPSQTPSGQVHAEGERLRSDLDGIKKRIRRLVTNLEAQEPSSEIADDIRSRLEELGTLRAKKQRALETAEKEMAQVPDPESAEALVGALPLLDVDWELLSDHDFRALLAALNFEATYEPTKRELTIRVTLVPQLTSPDGDRAPLLSGAPGRIRTRGAQCGTYPAGGPRCALGAPGGSRTKGAQMEEPCPSASDLPGRMKQSTAMTLTAMKLKPVNFPCRRLGARGSLA